MASFYVASRASIPERSAMWRHWRDVHKVPIVSSWIDEAGPGEVEDFRELWSRIHHEICDCDCLVFYAEPQDFPLKGAYIETGIALGLAKRVYAVLPGVELEGDTLRPVGSWLKHPFVRIMPDLASVFQ